MVGVGCGYLVGCRSRFMAPAFLYTFAHVLLPVSWIARSGVVYLEYAADKRCELIDNLWDVHSKGPWSARYLHVSM